MPKNPPCETHRGNWGGPQKSGKFCLFGQHILCLAGMARTKNLQAV